MPNRTDWMEPELAFRLRDGRPVYHCYRNDECNPNDVMRLVHHFTTSCTIEGEESREFVFDVRDFVGKFSWGDACPEHLRLPEGPQYDTQMAFNMAVAQRAYDAGMIAVPA